MKTPSPLLPLVGKQIGWLRLNKPIERHNASFECAAWWQDEKSETGVFPLYLSPVPFRDGEFAAAAKIPGKVVDCYFGALWCGNPIEGAPYDEKAKQADIAGRSATLHFSLPLSTLVENDGISQDNEGFDVAVFWEYVPAMLQHFKGETLRECAYLQTLVAELATDGREWGYLQYTAQRIAENDKAVAIIARSLKYRAEGFLADCRARNLAWVPQKNA